MAQFMDLPSELRTKICEYALGDCFVTALLDENGNAEVRHIEQNDTRGEWLCTNSKDLKKAGLEDTEYRRVVPPLLRTCRTIYLEAEALLDQTTYYTFLPIYSFVFTLIHNPIHNFLPRMRHVTVQISIYEVAYFYPITELFGSAPSLQLWFEAFFNLLNHQACSLTGLKLELAITPILRDHPAHGLASMEWYTTDPKITSKPFQPILDAWEILMIPMVVQLDTTPINSFHDVLGERLGPDWTMKKYPTFFKDFAYAEERRLIELERKTFLGAKHAKQVLRLARNYDTGVERHRRLRCQDEFVAAWERQHGTKPDWVNTWEDEVEA